MTKRVSVMSLYILALCGMAGSLVGQSVLLGETKIGSLSSQTSKEPSSFHAVVKDVLPAVVTIEANQKVTMARADLPGPHGNPFGDIPGLPDELRKRFEEFQHQPGPQDSVPRHAFGSGFLID